MRNVSTHNNKDCNAKNSHGCTGKILIHLRKKLKFNLSYNSMNFQYSKLKCNLQLNEAERYQIIGFRNS